MRETTDALDRYTGVAAARVLGVHPNTVRNLEKRGVIRAHRLPGSGRLRYPRVEIIRHHRKMYGTDPS